MKAGIAPALLISQVRNTAAWLWSDPHSRDVVGLLEGSGGQSEKSEKSEKSERKRETYFATMLAAHYATVATFVPTDVDARIRHHAWQELSTAEELVALVDVIDRVAAWDVHRVSARVHDDVKRGGSLSGHDGEWLAVRAGALGRAAVIGAEDVIDRLVAQIDAELDREEAICTEAFGSNANVTSATTAQTALSVATIVAHNLGDLSRVVAEWPKHERLASLQERFVRLGHSIVDSNDRNDRKPTPTTPRRATFVTAGALNKAIVAHENHRFLPLRKPRALRVDRSLLLPIGPWLDAWGETVAKCELLDNRDRAEVLAALLEVHARDPAQEGCLRAIAGLHRATRGGIELYVPDLPARLRKDALRGRVRDALDITVEHFAARIDRRYRGARDQERNR